MKGLGQVHHAGQALGDIITPEPISPRDTWCPVSGSHFSSPALHGLAALVSQLTHLFKPNMRGILPLRSLLRQQHAAEASPSSSWRRSQGQERTACAMGGAQEHQEVPGVLTTRMVQSLTLRSDCSLFQIKAIPYFQSSESSGVGLFLTHHGYKPLTGAVTPLLAALKALFPACSPAIHHE